MLGMKTLGAASKNMFEEMGASSVSQKLFASLGGMGNRGGVMTEMARGRSPFGAMNAAQRGTAQQTLQSMGQRRAAYSAGGVGLIGLSSGASGMRAKSSGGYTG